MGPDLSHIISASCFPHLLIAENNLSAVEPLIRTFGDRRLDVDFDLCTSPRSAVRKLLLSSYQLIVSGVHLAEMDDFLLLRRARALHTYVPVVVMANASEKDSARRVLTRGAFDLITTPLEHEQTVGTIRLALWQSKLMSLIARKEETLEKYRQHMTDYPGDRNKVVESFHRALAAFENTISTIERTMLRMEESMVCFADFATKVEYYARERALERLIALSK
ncbi:MAG TPA: response regulator [Nitrospira sp.]|nr:response regulator [Nitrospira sp.]